MFGAHDCCDTQSSGTIGGKLLSPRVDEPTCRRKIRCVRATGRRDESPVFEFLEKTLLVRVFNVAGLCGKVFFFLFFFFPFPIGTQIKSVIDSVVRDVYTRARPFVLYSMI
jgi:hypothetical protein